MAPISRDRDRRPARAPSRRRPNPWILIVTEGKVTEISYFKALRQHLRGSYTIPEIPPEHGDPLSLVHIAKEERKRREADAKREGDPTVFAEVWCVFDRDSFDPARLAQAMSDARDSNINIAFSNPCFELWLLLHFREQPGDRHRHDIQKAVSQFIPGYEKYVPPEAISRLELINDAISRAYRLDVEALEEGEPHRSPTTGVYRLVCRLFFYAMGSSGFGGSLSDAEAPSACRKVDCGQQS